MIRLSAAEARTLPRDALLAAGASVAVADAVSGHAVEAELAGHPSHGLGLIPKYCADAGTPGVLLDAQPRVTSRWGAVTTIDARQGLGHLALAMAVDSAAERSHEFGVGVSAIVQCGHAGRAGAWVERGVSRGCVTLVMLGGSEPPYVMAAAPGAAPALHTNPLAVGVPAAVHPLMLDMATSIVAEGKVRVALERHTILPEGSILSAEGLRSNDPEDFASGGSLLPVGGHKGFGLSAMVEALGVILTGADRAGRAPLEGGLVMCIDAQGFRPINEVMASVEALRSRIRESGAAGCVVLAPGDPEAQWREAAAGHLQIDDALGDRLRSLSSIP